MCADRVKIKKRKITHECFVYVVFKDFTPLCYANVFIFRIFEISREIKLKSEQKKPFKLDLKCLLLNGIAISFYFDIIFNFYWTQSFI